MSRTRIVKGTYTKITGGDHNMYAKGNIVTTAGKSINEIGKENGVTCNEPKKPPLAPKHFFVKGWWSSDLVGSKPIEEALIDDIVYFHAETKNIPDGDMVQMRLYDDDNNEIEEPKEKNDKSEYIETISSNKAGITNKKVNGNKIVIALRLANLEKFIANEADKKLELYYRCSYKGENVELPRASSDYLKVKGMPKIIFVNGHWNNIANKIGMSPGEGQKQYWIFFTGKFQEFKNRADRYFQFKQQSIEYFIDGSSLWGGSENGQERKDRGYKYAKEHFNEITKGLGDQPICLISHSEGGACASGVAKYLIERGVNVKESILLSCDEGDEFTIENNYPSYQLVAGYLDLDFITKKKYFKIDPVVKDNKIKGVTKYGVYISKSSFTTVHGATVDDNIFDLLKKLKSLTIEQVWNSKGKMVYQTFPKDEKWAKIDEYILYNSQIDYYPTRNSNIIEMYKKRED
ncbi:hypothetical protein [Flavobacterium davisii]|uniref:hypothetical protein n=1 Tax=Flavobacterium davisii TaxID=2906077 RepID=UPI0035CEAB16